VLYWYWGFRPASSQQDEEGEVAGTKSAQNKGHGDGAFFSQLALPSQ
jgi:hypothetical protein